MKHTAFTKIHESLGARMVPFAGYLMPVEYTGVNDEHIAVRTNVGVFDVSHMGEFWVKGPNALNFIQKVTTNDASVLSPGKIQYSCFPNGNGGIVDDLLVYHYESEKYLLVVNASNIEKDWNWLVSQNDVGAYLENASEKISQLAVQGPKSIEILQQLTNVNLSQIPYYQFAVGDFAGVPQVIISATGYTGAGGYELYFYNEYAEKIWKAIFEAGKEAGIKPAGLAARDTLRLEMGFCLYGNDIDDSTSPIAAGLGWITKFTDSKNFINKDLFLNHTLNGTKRKLVGFKMIDKGIPRQHYKIFDTQGNDIGEVTSGTMSPMLRIGIGLGYVESSFAKPGTEILLNIRNKNLKAEIVKLPFFKQ